MNRWLRLGLTLPLLALIALQPAALSPAQSPVASPGVFSSPLVSPSPPPADGAAQAGAALAPLAWVAAGFLLGGAIVLAVRRATPHDR